MSPLKAPGMISPLVSRLMATPKKGLSILSTVGCQVRGGFDYEDSDVLQIRNPGCSGTSGLLGIDTGLRSGERTRHPQYRALSCGICEARRRKSGRAALRAQDQRAPFPHRPAIAVSAP